jgi:hypothetical protein
MKKTILSLLSIGALCSLMLILACKKEDVDFSDYKATMQYLGLPE